MDVLVYAARIGISRALDENSRVVAALQVKRETGQLTPERVVDQLIDQHLKLTHMLRTIVSNLTEADEFYASSDEEEEEPVSPVSQLNEE